MFLRRLGPEEDIGELEWYDYEPFSPSDTKPYETIIFQYRSEGTPCPFTWSFMTDTVGGCNRHSSCKRDPPINHKQ